MKSLWLFAILTLLCGRGLAANGTGSLEGKITDKDSHLPLDGANVVLESTALGSKSGQNGFYLIQKIPAGIYQLEVSYIGFVNQTLDVVIKPGRTTTIDLALRPTSLDIGREIIILEKRDESDVVKNLLDQNLSSTEQVLSGVAGLHLVKRGNTSFDPVIRGVKENRLNVTIDGIKIFGACRGRMDPPTTYLEIEDLENIEIVKGPNSVSMGSNTLGGGINLVSKKPQRFSELTVTGSAEAAYHSVADGKKGTVGLQAGGSDLAFRANGTYQDFSSFESGSGKVSGSSFGRISYNAMAAYFPDEEKTITLSLMGNVGEDVGYPVLPMDADEDKGTILSASYKQNHLLNHWSALKAQVYFNRVDHIMSNRKRPSYQNMQAEVDSWTRTYGTNVSNTFVFSNQVLNTGFDYYRVNAEATRTVTMVMNGMTNTFLDWPDVSVGVAGFFAEYKNYLTDRFSFSAGVRTDRSSASADKASGEFLDFWEMSSQPSSQITVISGNTSVNYRFHPDWSAGLSFGRGTRVPDFTEYFAFYAISRADNYDYIGNPGLDHETNWNVELSSAVDRPAYHLEGSVFYSRVQNYITGRLLDGVNPRTTGAAGVRVYDNIGEAEIYGFESNAHIHLPWNLHMLGFASYSRGTDRETDDPLFEMPPFEGTVGIKYVNPRYSFWIQLNGRFVAKQDRVSELAGELPTPGFRVFDIRAGYTRFKRFHVHAGVENLLNRTYFEHLNRGDLLSPGRNIYVSLKTSF